MKELMSGLMIIGGFKYPAPPLTRKQFTMWNPRICKMLRKQLGKVGVDFNVLVDV